MNNTNLVSAIALADLDANELLIISVRDNANVRYRKPTASYWTLFQVISELLEDALTKSECTARRQSSLFRNRKRDQVFPRGYLRFRRRANRRCSLNSRSTQRIGYDENRRVSLAALAIALVLATNAFAQQKSEPISRDTGTDLLWKKLESRVRAIADKFDGVIGVAILDLTDGRILSLNGDHVFPTASSIKIAVLLELYRQDQETRSGGQQKARLDDTYTFDPKDLVEDSRIMSGLTAGVTHVTNRDLAQFMTAVSDNAAANILIDRVGKDKVNATLRGLGLSKTMLRRKMIDLAAARRGDENVATPEEMVRLLEAIYKEKILSKEASAALIKQLSTLKQSYIPRLLPENVQVANKPGELEAVRTDSGIVFAANRPFAISVMTAYDRDERAAERAISEIAVEAYRYFEMRGKTSEYGRALPLEENR